jgi:hypothetical protein
MDIFVVYNYKLNKPMKLTLSRIEANKFAKQFSIKEKNVRFGVFEKLGNGYYKYGHYINGVYTKDFKSV